MPKREATAAADSLPVRSRGPVKVKLTKTGLFEAIDHCGKAERYMVWDTEVAGLMARVSPKGATLFLDYRAWDGKQSRLKLARLDKATDIDAVRKMAAAKRLEVAAGGNPQADKVAARSAQPGQTVAAVFGLWMKNKEPAWSTSTLRAYEEDLKRYIAPALGSKLFAETSRKDWVHLVDGIGSVSVKVRVWSCCRAMIGWAFARDYHPAPFFLPARKHIAPPLPPKDRPLPDASIAALWRYTEQAQPKVAAFCRIILLTGQRKSLVEGMMWEHIDLDSGIWTIPKGTKGLKKLPYDHRVWLAPEAVAALRAVPVRHRTWVFGEPGTEEDGPNLEKSVKRVLRNARNLEGNPLPLWGWHDIRSAIRTHLDALEVSSTWSRAALAQVANRDAIDRAYSKHQFAPQGEKALKLWADHLQEIISGTAAPSNVVALRGGQS